MACSLSYRLSVDLYCRLYCNQNSASCLDVPCIFSYPGRHNYLQLAENHRLGLCVLRASKASRAYACLFTVTRYTLCQKRNAISRKLRADGFWSYKLERHEKREIIKTKRSPCHPSKRTSYRKSRLQGSRHQVSRSTVRDAARRLGFLRFPETSLGRSEIKRILKPSYKRIVPNRSRKTLERLSLACAMAIVRYISSAEGDRSLSRLQSLYSESFERDVKRSKAVDAAALLISYVRSFHNENISPPMLQM